MLKRVAIRVRFYPINLSSDKILGLKAYSSLTEIKEKIDVVLIVIPAKFVKAEVEKCVKLNIKILLLSVLDLKS